MKIALTVKENSPDSPLDEHFGRCAYICIVDAESGENKIIDNSEGASASHGAGINAAQVLAENGVEVLITGSIGPKAAKALEAAEISVYASKGSTIVEALKRFKDGKLEKVL